jgi:hypothetical protein
MKIIVKKCDICQKEQRDDETIHWSQRYGKMILSFADVPGIQCSYDYEVCLTCASEFDSVISKLLVELKGNKNEL